MDYKILDELVAIEKKSEASKEKKKQYLSQMRDLFSEEGFSEKAQDYLCAGFSFEGAKPLAEYIQSCTKENIQDIISTVFGSPMMKQNKRGIAYKMSLSLLGFATNDYTVDDAVIAALVNVIPKKALDPEGKMFKDAFNNFQRLFLCRVVPKTRLIPLHQLNLKSVVLDRFETYITAMMASIDRPQNIHPMASEMINDWLKSRNVQQEINVSKSAENEMCSEKNESEPMECKKTKPVTLPIVDSNAVENQEKKVQPKEILQYKEIINKILPRLDVLAGQMKASEKEVRALKSRNEIALSEKSELETRLLESSAALSSAKKDIENQGCKISLMEKELLKDKAELKDRDDEIQRLKSIITVYSADKANAQSEQLNAIASKLKAEYRDFCDAEEMEMTPDLGENMRLQLKAVFKILIKAGIDIEGK